jgi:hypothetical protein
MAFKDLVALSFERLNATQTYWGFYITIVLGLLAVFGTVRKSRAKRNLAAILSAGYLCFALVNLGGIIGATATRKAVYSLLMTSNYAEGQAVDQAQFRSLQSELKPSPVWAFTLVHSIGDAGVLCAIWVLTLGKDGERSLA